MKKLLIILSCVAATVGLCAQDTFEDRTVGAFTDDIKTNTLWFVSDSTEAEIAQETSGNQYLQITDSPSDDPLYRAYSVTLNQTAGDYEPDSVSVPSAGIYFDAKVQFSVSDTLDQAAVDEHAKFAFFAYCDEDSGETNLVARAAFHTSVLNKEATNYFLNLPEGVVLNPDTWYRVTIKTIPLTSNYGLYGYIVYLDEKLLSYDEGVTCGTDETFVNSLTATARKYYDSKDYGHSLLPGMTSSAQIDRVVFAGTGALDDVDWTTTAPDFAKDETLITLKWDKGVKSITFGQTVVDVTAGSSTNIAVAADTKTVNITTELNDGYAFTSWKDGEVATTAPTTYDLTTYQYQVTVDGKAYEKIGDAVEAAINNSKPLVLVKNLADQVYVETEGTLVIDLNGHDITVPEVPDYEVPILISAACNLIITNSSETLGTVYAIKSSTYNGTYSVCVEANGATVTVYENCKFEGDFYAYQVTCYGGIFKNVTGENEFLYTPAEGYEATLTGDYWTVAKETTKTPLEIFIAAIEAATDDATVTLTDDITLTDRIDVDINKAITIDLGGKTVKPTATCANGSAFNIVSGTVTFKNGTIDGTAIIDADVTAGNKECDPITVRSGAKVTLVDTLVIKIKSKNGACVYVFNGGTAEITGGTYENSTTEDYQHKAGYKGMAVNQENVATQLITIKGGKFSQQNPATGDDYGCTTFLAADHKSVLTDGYYIVQKKTTPSTWTDVNPETQDLADVVANDQLTELQEAGITVEALRTWATNYVSATTAPGVDIDLEALTLNCAPGEANVAKAKEDFKATQEDLNAIITADKSGDETALVNAVMSLYKDTYPNATVTVEKITADNATSALYSTDTLKLFRLKITLGRSE